MVSRVRSAAISAQAEAMISAGPGQWYITRPRSDAPRAQIPASITAISHRTAIVL